MSDSPAIIIPGRHIISPSESIAIDKWTRKSAFISHHHYQPDIQALHCLMAALTGQFDPHSQPIWMFLNGVSGSGKTAIGINPLMNLPNVYTVDSLTPHTLFSGYIGAKNPGLMSRIGKTGTILIPDFTTILSLRDDNRKEIAGQCRRVYDGKYDPENGAATAKSWEGKLTIIAAVTPIIERYWGLLRDMGDRFLQVRWPRLDGPSVARMSRSHQGIEDMIKSRMAADALDFFTSPRMNYVNIPDLTEAQGNSIDALSDITCHLVAHVTRDNSGNREIIDVPSIDQTGRIGKGLPALIRYSAVMFRRDIIRDEDIAIAKRVALDTIPFIRSRIITHIPPDDSIAADDLSKLLGIPPTTIRWTGEELESLGVIKVSTNSMGTCYEMTKHIREMWKLAFPNS